jgi:hypothetical protein
MLTAILSRNNRVIVVRDELVCAVSKEIPLFDDMLIDFLHLAAVLAGNVDCFVFKQLFSIDRVFEVVSEQCLGINTSNREGDTQRLTRVFGVRVLGLFGFVGL